MCGYCEPLRLRCCLWRTSTRLWLSYLSLPFVIPLLQRQFISSPTSYHVGQRGIRLAQNKQCLFHRNKVRLQTAPEMPSIGSVTIGSLMVSDILFLLTWVLWWKSVTYDGRSVCFKVFLLLLDWKAERLYLRIFA